MIAMQADPVGGHAVHVGIHAPRRHRNPRRIELELRGSGALLGQGCLLLLPILPHLPQIVRGPSQKLKHATVSIECTGEYLVPQLGPKS